MAGWGGLLRGPDGTVRAPWRLGVFGGLTLVLGGLALAVVAPLADCTLHPDAPSAAEAAAFALATLGATRLAVGAFEGGDWAVAGLGRGCAAPRALAEGALVGTAAIGAPLAILLAAGALRFAPGDAGDPIAAGVAALLVLAPAALAEELLTRGYVLGVLRQVVGTGRAVVLTSLAFAALHAGNPGGSGWQPVAGVFAAGVLLAVVRLVTGSVLAAWTAHLAVNVVQGPVAHAPVSGLPLPAPGWRLVDAGPAWATGGTWGVEAGLVTVVAMGAAAGWLLARRGPRATGTATPPAQETT